MNVLTFLPFLVFAVIAVVICLAARRSGLQGGLSTGTRLISTNGVINVEGRQVLCHYKPRRRKSVSRLTLSYSGGFYAHAVFHQESSVDQAAKQMGINREVQTNDYGFDGAVYVECEDEYFVKQFLESAENRMMIKEVVKTFNSFEIDGSTCRLVKTPCDDYSVLSQGELEAAARALVQLSAAVPLPAPGQASATPQTDEVRGTSALCVGMSVVVFIAGIVLVIWGLSAYEPVFKGQLFQSSLPYSLPLFGFTTWAAYSYLKGFSTSAKTLMLMVLLCLPGFLLTGWGTAMVANGAMDVSAAEPHDTAIIGKRISRSKDSTSYYVKVASWRPDLVSYEFKVSRSEYGRLSSGDCCTITTRGGLFHCDWVLKRHCKAGCSRESGT